MIKSIQPSSRRSTEHANRDIESNSISQYAATSQQNQAVLKLDESILEYVVSLIPAERNDELLRDMAKASSTNDAKYARELIVRWIMIGSFFADPHRAENHPLRNVFGAFKSESQWDAIVKGIANRRQSTDLTEE